MAADSQCATRVAADHLVMGAQAAVVAPIPIADRVIKRLDQLESLWSRFLPNSEITQLNQAGGRPLTVSGDTIALLEAAALAWSATNSAFDPTLLGALAALGYDRSRHHPEHISMIPAGAVERGTPAEILIDRATSRVSLPPGTLIDPGGIGKGLAADLVIDEFGHEAGSLLVEIGGDLRVGGRPPEGGWQVDVWDAERSAPRHRIALLSGGVATSSILLRRWLRPDGSQAHHLLDSRTRIPSATGVAACTVIAGSAAWAEAFTKVPFSRPLQSALELFNHHNLAALITTDDGAEHSTSTWSDFLR